MDTLRALNRKGIVIAINFCGGCNPHIDRSAIASAIRDALVACGFAVAFNAREADFFVRLSGCTANCAARSHPSEHASVTIAGPTFGAVAVDAARLADLAIDAVVAHFAARPWGRPGHSSDGSHGATHHQTSGETRSGQEEQS